MHVGPLLNTAAGCKHIISVCYVALMLGRWAGDDPWWLPLRGLFVVGCRPGAAQATCLIGCKELTADACVGMIMSLMRLLQSVAD